VRVCAPIPIVARRARPTSASSLRSPALSDSIAYDDTGSDGATLGGGSQISLSENIEHHDRDFIIHAEGESGGIHDLQAAAQGVPVSDGLKALSAGVGLGIGIVDSVYLSGLEEGIGPDLAGAKGGGGVGGKEGVACASGENDHTTFFQMA